MSHGLGLRLGRGLDRRQTDRTGRCLGGGLLDFVLHEVRSHATQDALEPISGGNPLLDGGGRLDHFRGGGPLDGRFRPAGGRSSQAGASALLGAGPIGDLGSRQTLGSLASPLGDPGAARRRLSRGDNRLHRNLPLGFDLVGRLLGQCFADLGGTQILAGLVGSQHRITRQLLFQLGDCRGQFVETFASNLGVGIGGQGQAVFAEGLVKVTFHRTGQGQVGVGVALAAATPLEGGQGFSIALLAGIHQTEVVVGTLVVVIQRDGLAEVHFRIVPTALEVHAVAHVAVNVCAAGFQLDRLRVVAV